MCRVRTLQHSPSSSLFFVVVIDFPFTYPVAANTAAAFSSYSQLTFRAIKIKFYIYLHFHCSSTLHFFV